MSYETDVRQIAAQVGIDVDDDAVAAYAEAAEALGGQFAALEPSPPEDDPATDVTDGDDAYNAVRHRFELPATDGPLSALAVGVKDNMAVAGVPMHCGSAAVSVTPSYHATAVARLHDAGADVVATTNMDEFAYFTTGETCAFGPTDNPAVEGCVPGGSSSGSGAAVAADVLDAALGSDTGGSVRIPASFCGVVGLKPTHRAVPRFGFADLAPSLDCIGPLAADVETAARIYDALAGPGPRDPSSLSGDPSTDAAAGVDDSVVDYRVGVVDPAMADADDAVADAVSAAVETLDGAGVDSERVDLPGYRIATMAGLAIAGAEFSALALSEGQVRGTGTGYSETWRAAFADAVASPELGGNVREQILTNGALCRDSVAHYVAAKGVGADFTATVTDALADYDALVLPTTPMTAPGFGDVETDEEFARTVANTVPFNVSGHPGLSVPGGEVDGAPVGVQFVGSRDDERTLVALGAALEAQRG
jgi:Asp-tRNA(Asn)/Glu-tRNA(Gln) amidotransferase A subunit family amidase